MLNLINLYQKEFSKVTEKLISNDNNLACFVIGSMVNGDIWQGSDIDLIIVQKYSQEKFREVYATEGEVPIQAKFIDYNQFLIKEKSIVKKLKNSKIVFCKDEKVNCIYQDLRYNFNHDGDINRLIYLGNILKDKVICEKYLNNGGINTSYEILIRILNNVSKLYLNINGYSVSKDSVNMASTFDEEFSSIVYELYNSPVSTHSISSTLEYIEKFISNNIEESCCYILSFLKEYDDFLSSNDIKKNSDFYKVNIEHILKELSNKNLIKSKYRQYNGLNENVYAYIGVSI